MTLRLLAACLAFAVMEFSIGTVVAWAQSGAVPVMSVTAVEQFLTGAGLKACEISEIDPFISKVNRAIKSLSIGVAADCADYDPEDPTVVVVHQFANQRARDAMAASLRDLRYRALRAYADLWIVDNYVVVLLGPQRQQVQALLEAEYRRRHKDQSVGD
jgi:hypothetical protein